MTVAELAKYVLRLDVLERKLFDVEERLEDNATCDSIPESSLKGTLEWMFKA